MKNLIFAVLLIIPVSVDAQIYTGDEEDIQHILNNIKGFSESVMNADYEAIANAYTEDAKIMVNNRDVIEGREKIKIYWTPGGAARTIYHKIYPIEISITGETAYDYGRYEGTTKLANGEESGWKGKYVIIWKKIDDEWKIYVDIWNRTE